MTGDEAATRTSGETGSFEDKGVRGRKEAVVEGRWDNIKEPSGKENKLSEEVRQYQTHFTSKKNQNRDSKSISEEEVGWGIQDKKRKAKASNRSSTQT